MSKKKLKNWSRLEEKKGNGISVKTVLIIGVLVFGGLGFLALNLNAPSNTNSSSAASGLASASIGDIHWHADATFNICGEQRNLPTPKSDVHLGSQLLHTHQDGRMHIEGFVASPSAITLEKFMRSVGITFTNEQLFEKKNGDKCNETAGKVVLLVNGQRNGALSQYSIRDGDRFEINFE